MSVLIKGGRIVTAADDYVGDVFVEGERISLIGESLDVAADKVIDATGKYVLPGLRRPAHAPRHALRRHGRRSTTSSRARPPPRSAARPATSTSASSRQGTTLRATRSPTGTRRPNGKQVIDMGYHIAVTDLDERRHARGARDAARPGDHVLQALHGLQGRADGRRRDALPDDGGRGGDRRARDGARRERRRDRRARQGGARRRAHRAELPRADAAARDRGRGDEPGDPARARRRLRRSTSSTSRARSRSSRSRSRARRAGTSGARPARSTSSSTTRSSSGRTSRARSTSTRRRRATRRTRTCSGTPCARDVALGDLDRPLRVPLGRPEDDGQGRLLEDPERRPGAREPAAHDPPLRRPRGPDLAQPDGRAALRRTRRSCSASTRARARSRPARTRTS